MDTLLQFIIYLTYFLTPAMAFGAIGYGSVQHDKKKCLLFVILMIVAAVCHFGSKYLLMTAL